MKEIEYKYLVDKKLWNTIKKPKPDFITQGYISKNKDCTSRIRINNNRAFITIKGKNKGIVRQEFQYEIPLNEANVILKDLIDKKIKKHRYKIEFSNRIWEVDEFKGKLEGLIIAELEVNSEEEKFELPFWVTKDVSLDPNYYNSVLINKA